MEGAAATVRPHHCALLAAVQAPRESRVQVLPLPMHGDAPVAIGPHHPFYRLHVTPAAIRLAVASDVATLPSHRIDRRASPPARRRRPFRLLGLGRLLRTHI